MLKSFKSRLGGKNSDSGWRETGAGTVLILRRHLTVTPLSPLSKGKAFHPLFIAIAIALPFSPPFVLFAWFSSSWERHSLFIPLDSYFTFFFANYLTRIAHSETTHPGASLILPFTSWSHYQPLPPPPLPYPHALRNPIKHHHQEFLDSPDVFGLTVWKLATLLLYSAAAGVFTPKVRGH